MATDMSFKRADQAQILARLRTLRMSLAHARDVLMHFRGDRLDRDKLEPAARRVDDLMNMFVRTSSDRTQASLWISEIQAGVEQVTNPKAAEALRDARVDVAALFDMMSLEPTAITS
jgi:ribosomal protein L22